MTLFYNLWRMRLSVFQFCFIKKCLSVSVSIPYCTSCNRWGEWITHIVISWRQWSDSLRWALNNWCCHIANCIARRNCWHCPIVCSVHSHISVAVTFFTVYSNTMLILKCCLLCTLKAFVVVSHYSACIVILCWYCNMTYSVCRNLSVTVTLFTAYTVLILSLWLLCILKPS